MRNPIASRPTRLFVSSESASPTEAKNDAEASKGANAARSNVLECRLFVRRLSKGSAAETDEVIPPPREVFEERIAARIIPYAGVRTLAALRCVSKACRAACDAAPAEAYGEFVPHRALQGPDDWANAVREKGVIESSLLPRVLSVCAPPIRARALAQFRARAVTFAEEALRRGKPDEALVTLQWANRTEDRSRARELWCQALANRPFEKLFLEGTLDSSWAEAQRKLWSVAGDAARRIDLAKACGFSLEAPDASGMTPYQHAILGGDTALAQALVDAGAAVVNAPLLSDN